MTARFTTLQKVILLLLAAMTVIFALLTAVSRSRPGVSFEGALLRSTQEGEAALDALVSRVEPALVLVCSLLVGLILLSVMLPLMHIMAAIG